MTEMTPEERALYDAQADHEAWSLAHEILEPLVRATRPIGSAELTRVMEGALSEVDAEIGRTLDVWEGRREERDPSANPLGEANSHLAGALEALEALPEGGSFDAEAIRKARQSIAEAGYLVASEERKLVERSRPAE